MSLGTVASAMRGVGVVSVNQEISHYVKSKQLDIAVTLRSQYGFGDGVQQEQLWDLLRDRASITIGGVDSADADAQTKRDGDKRVIHLNGYRAGMSKEEQLRLGITLAHEAYRNGIDDGMAGQRLETNQAVLGHIGFAANMAGTYGVGSIGKDMALEVVAYMKALQGDTKALSEVLSSYDSSADYWKVIKGKDGKVAQVIDDGDYEHLNIYGADGKQEKQVAYTKGTSLVNTILNGAEGLPAEQRGQENWDRINQVLIASGLDYEAGGRGWYAKSEAAKAERAKAIAELNRPTTTEIQKPGFLQQVTGFFSDIFRGKGIFKEAHQANMTANKTMLDMIGGLFQRPKVEEKREQRQPLSRDNINQEMIEQRLGLPKPSACAITSYSWIDNEYLRTLGGGLNSEELITLIRGAKGTGYNDKGWVTSYDELGKAIHKENYLQFYKDYTSLEELQRDGITYYLIKCINKEDQDRTHYLGSANGREFDPDITTKKENRWWEKKEKRSVTYRAFKK